MQVLVIQNDPMGPPALFGTWLEAQGAVLTIVAPDALPGTADGFDLIVTLGSPYGAYDDLPWIAPQRDLLRAAAEQNRAVIGICFGAQHDQRPDLRNDRGRSHRAPRRARWKGVLLLQRPLPAKVSVRARRSEARWLRPQSFRRSGLCSLISILSWSWFFLCCCYGTWIFAITLFLAWHRHGDTGTWRRGKG